jgi:6,7-dimethyl-8-ribityllumazine synthase
MRLGIVASRFNEAIAAELLKRAQGAARELGVEPPSSACRARSRFRSRCSGWRSRDASTRSPPWGVVIRGETYHFEIVANESARGLMDVALECGLPIANGILTTEDEPQALARLDKGAEAVRVAVEMGKLRARLKGEGA